MIFSSALACTPNKVTPYFHSVHWGINPPSKTSPRKSANCRSPLFRKSPHLYWFFMTPHPRPKSRIFQSNPELLKFLILTPSYLLKVTKFLVKTSQFEFLVMTKKNIFAYKLFLSLYIFDFSLFFYVKIATIPLTKVTPSFSPTPSKSLGRV